MERQFFCVFWSLGGVVAAGGASPALAVAVGGVAGVTEAGAAGSLASSGSSGSSVGASATPKLPIVNLYFHCTNSESSSYGRLNTLCMCVFGPVLLNLCGPTLHSHATLLHPAFVGIRICGLFIGLTRTHSSTDSIRSMVHGVADDTRAFLSDSSLSCHPTWPSIIPF